MYASVIHSSQGGIYVSDNINQGNASNWTKLTNPPRTEGHPYNILTLKDGSLLCTYSGRMSNDRKTFYPSSGVFYSTDKGATWLDRSDANMYYWTKDVEIDPSDNTQNTWFAGVYSGWGGAANNKGGLYKTTNRGVSWTKILSLARVESCTINPLNSEEMYVTSEYEGLYFTKNLKSSSPSFSLVDSYPFKHPLRVFYNPNKQDEIWVTSFGYGIVKSKSGATKVISVALSPESAALTIGDSIQLSVSILPANADNKNIGFNSLNESIATVSQSGLVSAIAEGETNIVVKTEDGGFTDTCKVTVINGTSIYDKYESVFFIKPNLVEDYRLLNFSDYYNNFEIFNTLGIKVIEMQYQPKIDISALSSGIYFLKAGNRVYKFVKV